MPTPRNSTNLKLLLGSRSDRIDTTTPIPARREPDPLPWFTVRQRQIWDDVVTELRDMDLLSRADRMEIAAYVAVAANLELIATEINNAPVWVSTTKYGRQADPLVLMFDRMAMRLSNLGGKLGLSPAGRASIRGRQPINAAEPDASNPFAS